MQPLEARQKLAIAALKSFPYYKFCLNRGPQNCPIIIFEVPEYRPYTPLDSVRYNLGCFVVQDILRLNSKPWQPLGKLPPMTQEQEDQCLALLNKFPDIFPVFCSWNGAEAQSHSFSVAVRSLPDELFQNARPW